MFESQIGFLPQPRALTVPGLLSLAPLDDFAVTRDNVAEAMHRDGHLYPPPIFEVAVDRRRDPDTGAWTEHDGARIPKTERPARHWFLPPSHRLIVDQPVATDILNGDTSFLVHLFTYLWGYRLQIDGWAVDGRVSVKSSNHHVHVLQPAAESFVEKAYTKWRQHAPELQNLLITLLYIHGKAPSYEEMWEQFLMEYIVTDAIWSYCSQLKIVSGNPRHGDRIEKLSVALQVWYDSAAPVKEIVRIRNELFHQGLWVGGRPGYHVSENEWDRAHELRALNQRLIAGVFGGAPAYCASAWTDWRQQYFFQ